METPSGLGSLLAWRAQAATLPGLQSTPVSRSPGSASRSLRKPYGRLFAEAIQKRADALYVGPASQFFTSRQRIAELAENYRLPTIYCYPEFVTVGGLMSYGPDLTRLGRYAAGQVHQILSGSKPSEIPVYQADRFSLVLNLKAARAIEFTFP